MNRARAAGRGERWDSRNSLPTSIHLREVARFRFLRIAITVPWDIIQELELEFEAKKS